MPAFLADHGLNACHLAVCYHGGRMLLPRHPSRRVYDHGTGGLYLPLDLKSPAAPVVEDWSSTILPLVHSGFPVHAWIVLGHRDNAPLQYTMRNVYGDPYTYALCPSYEPVRESWAELCRELSKTGYFASLQLEAPGFMGYAHGSLHEKSGTSVSREAEWLLSVCTCEACTLGYGPAGFDLIAQTRDTLDRYFANGETPAIAPELEELVITYRRKVQIEALRAIRSEVRTPICLRTANNRRFVGGKSSLEFGAFDDLAGSATLTWFGASADAIHADIAKLPPRTLPTYGGFVFHEPDCRTESDFRARYDAARALDGVIFYSYAMAAEKHWHWLKNAAA
jgi:hypothetical protein